MREKIIKICDRSLEALWLAVVFFTPLLLFYPLNYDIFGLPRMMFFCASVELMLIIYVAKIFIENKITSKVNKAVIILIGLVVLSYLLNLVFSIHPLKSWLGSFFRRQGAYAVIHYFLFLLLLILNFQNWPQIRRTILTILASSAPVCFYGILQFLGLDLVDWASPVAETKRIFSTLGQPNFLGHYLIIVIPLTAYSLVYFFKIFFDRFIILILLLAQIFCLIFTMSRAAWVGFFAEFILFILVLFIFNRKIIWKNKKKAIGVFILATSFIIIFINAIVITNSSSNLLLIRVRNIVNMKSGSVQVRLLMWGAAIDEIKQMDLKRLMFGYGQENLGDIYVKYYQPDWGIYEKINSYSDRSHNTILDIILANGFSVLLILAVFYGYIFYLTIRCLKKPSRLEDRYWLIICLIIILAGYFVNNLFSFSVTITDIYLFAILGILVWLSAENNQPKEINFNFFSNLSKVLIVINLIALIMIVTWYYNIKFLIADYYLMNVNKEINMGDKSCEIIINNLNSSIKWNPFISYNLDQYIYCNINCLNNENSDGANKLIKENIEKVIDLTGERELTFEAKINIARAYSLFGYFFSDPDYYAKADKMFKELNEISPNHTYVYRDWARIKQWQGDYNGEMELLMEGLKVIPDKNDSRLLDIVNWERKKDVEGELLIFYYQLGKIYQSQNNLGEAIKYFKKALDLNPYNLTTYKDLADVYYLNKELDKAAWYNKRAAMLRIDGQVNN